MTTNTPLESSSSIKADKEDFRMYHNQQYERIAQLESQRLTITNFVVGFSIVAFTIGFDDITNLNVINGLGLPLVIIASNLFAIIYANKSRTFVKMHQERADKARSMFAPELNDINREVTKVDSNKDLFNRTRLQTYLHVTFIFISIFVVVLYFL